MDQESYTKVELRCSQAKLAAQTESVYLRPICMADFISGWTKPDIAVRSIRKSRVA